MSEPERLQARYYAETAADYDDSHVHGGDEHYRALLFISALIRELQIESILDVGAGTGRGVGYFLERHDELLVRGVEPVKALVDQAVHRRGLPADVFVEGRGESLPFADRSFDAVCEFAVLHHVREPARVVSELLRVARRAVFLSDDNRFGHGPAPVRLLKLATHRVGLWPLANYVKTRGRGYTVSDGDGVAYSYSVYDSLPQLDAWADRIVLVPTAGSGFGRVTGPLLTAPRMLVCALRDA